MSARGPEAKIFPVLDELGIGVTAYGVLSRGLLSASKPAAAGDIRNRLPRFNGDNLVRNQQVVARLEQIADGKGITPAQLALAWVRAKGGAIVPVMGARTRTQLNEVLGALDVKLTADEVAEIEAAIPPDAVAGTRYDEQQMRVLDSEK